jgi:hypothetical protein
MDAMTKKGRSPAGKAVKMRSQILTFVQLLHCGIDLFLSERFFGRQMKQESRKLVLVERPGFILVEAVKYLPGAR